MTEPAAAAAPAPTDPTAAPPAAAAPGPPAAHDAAAAAAPPARDPRFATCGFAKLLGDNGLEYYVQKYEIVLGRRSKAGNVDVVLGDSAVLSRQHARIYFNFEAQRWELVAEGKNGVSVNGSLLTPQSGPQPLQSQDFLQAGDQNLYFLLPRQPRKPRAPKAKPGTPPPQQQDLQQQVQQQQQQQVQQQQQQQVQQQQQQQVQQQQPPKAGLLPASSGPLLPGVGNVRPGGGWSSPQLGLPLQVAAGSSGSGLPQPLGFGGLQLQLQAGGGASRGGLGGASGGGGLVLPQESTELGLGLGLLSPGAGGMRLLEDDAGGDEQGGDMQLG